MTLGDALIGLSALRPSFGPDREKLAAGCAEIRDHWPSLSSTTPENLGRLVDRCSRRLTTGDWSDATEAEIAPVLRAVAAGEVTIPDEVVVFATQEANLTSRTSLLAAYTEGLVEGWLAGGAHTVAAATILARRAEAVPSPFGDLLNRVPELLRAQSGAQDLAARLSQQPAPYPWMQKLGFAIPHAAGFPTAVSDSFLDQVPEPRDREAVDRLLQWCRPQDGGGIGDTGLLKTVDLLTAPWVSATPPDALRTHLSTWLVAEIGDPRRPGGKGLWQQASKQSRRVMLSWLAGRSVEAFMDVISSVEVEKRDTWRERRVFWTALTREGLVSEAWVALHPAARDEAKRRHVATDDPAYTAFGHQDGGRRDTSLLIMRAGDRIVVEGSRNYRVHVFDAGFPGRPDLYRQSYRDQDITLDKDDDLNTRWHRGGWQDWVRRRLA